MHKRTSPADRAIIAGQFNKLGRLIKEENQPLISNLKVEETDIWSTLSRLSGIPVQNYPRQIAKNICT